MMRVYLLHGVGNDVGHLQEAAASLPEGFVDHLIGGIERAGDISSLAHGLIS